MRKRSSIIIPRALVCFLPIIAAEVNKRYSISMKGISVLNMLSGIKTDVLRSILQEGKPSKISPAEISKSRDILSLSFKYINENPPQRAVISSTA